jgi:adenosylcobinamide-phosphate synthase
VREHLLVPLTPAVARAGGLALGLLLDAVCGDPRRGHPVAAFGRLVSALERRLHADAVAPGAALVVLSLAGPVAGGWAVERVGRRRPLLGIALTAASTWAVLGGTSLAREGTAMARLLEDGDLPAARRRLTHLCARDPARLDAAGLARATVESLAENTSDAVVAPLLWGAVAGVPGLLGYRAVNTLDAMVGYTSPRYLRFGRVAARLDDLVNLVPARVTGVLTVLAAPAVGGSPGRTWTVLRRDGGRHPSPNAGRPEAAAAGALGVRLGGTNVYDGHVEQRPDLGEGGRAPRVEDVRRAVRLGRVVGLAGAVVSVALASALGARQGRKNGPAPEELRGGQGRGPHPQTSLRALATRRGAPR